MRDFVHFILILLKFRIVDCRLVQLSPIEINLLLLCSFTRALLLLPFCLSVFRSFNLFSIWNTLVSSVWIDVRKNNPGVEVDLLPGYYPSNRRCRLIPTMGKNISDVMKMLNASKSFCMINALMLKSELEEL
jgi:hypothetical protein